MNTWHTMPFVRLILPFSLGILSASFFPFVPSSALFCMPIVSFLFLLFLALKQQRFRFRGLFGIPLSIFLFSIGYLSTALHDDRNQPNHFSQSLSEGSPITLMGIVEEKVDKGKNIRITLNIKELCDNPDSLLPAAGNLLLYLKKDSTLTLPPQYGDVLLVQTTVRAIEGPKNPDAMDFKQYWHFQNIHYQGFIKSSDTKVLEHEKGNWLISKAKNWNNHFVEILKQYLNTEDEFAVGSALILGSKDAVREDIRDAYVATGAMHILAISGMHILLIFSQLEKILNLYKTGNRRIRWAKTIFLIVLIALFALLTGAGSSVVRAAVMASFLAIGKAINRKGNVLNLVMASAFCLLIFNPFWLFDVGFQLSYTAVIGITLFADKLKKIFVFNHKLFNWVWQNIAIGLAAQLAVTPISLYYFHQFPTYFWLSGLLVGAVADGALMAGVLLLCFNGIPFLNFVLAKILFCFLWLMNQLIFSIQKLPFNLIEGIQISLISILLVYACIYSFWMAVKTRKLGVLYYPLSILLVLMYFYAFKSIKSRATKQMVIYNIPKLTLIEVYVEKKCYSFFEKFSKNLEAENRIKFAAQNHRNSLAINELEAFNFNEYVKYDDFLYQNKYIVIHNTKVLILDILPKKPLFLRTDFVVIKSNPKLTIQELKQMFDFSQIIFDTSNSKWRVENWKKECQALGYNYHDVAEMGAWVHNF
jgi:competence protein ComEC